MLRWAGEPAQRLLERVIAAADQFTVDIKSKGEPRFRWFSEMWANVSPPGAVEPDRTSIRGAFWSAVYYVEDGYGGSADDSLGGELVLIDPRMPAIRMHAPDLRVPEAGASSRRPSRMDPAGKRPDRAVPGLAVAHRRTVDKGQGNRISIAHEHQRRARVSAWSKS